MRPQKVDQMIVSLERKEKKSNQDRNNHRMMNKKGEVY